MNHIALPLFEAFEGAGEELYLVGGAVRDFLIHRMDNDPLISNIQSNEIFKPKDLDFSTSALPQKTKSILASAGFPSYDIGIDFGTIGTKFLEYDAEITTYRCAESYKKGNRKPTVKFGKSLCEDLARRDFTCNAIAMDRYGTIHDPLGGFADLVQGLLATPQEPTDSFTDDPLRMIRAFRFESQINASLMHAEAEAIRNLKSQIHNISMERIFDEISKLLMTPQPKTALSHMADSGLLGEIFPELQIVIDFKQNQGKWHSKLVWQHVLDVVDNTPAILPVRWAALFHDVCKPQTYSENESGVHFYGHEPLGASSWNIIADRLRVSKRFKDEVYFLIHEHLRPAMLCNIDIDHITDSAIRRFIRDCGCYLDNLFHLSLADITSHKPDVVQQKKANCLRLKDRIDLITSQCDVRKLALPTGLGKIIAKELNIAHGPELGRIMRQLKDDLVSGVVNADTDLADAARRIYGRYKAV